MLRRHFGDDLTLIHNVTAPRHGADHLKDLFNEDDGDAQRTVEVDRNPGDLHRHAGEDLAALGT